MPRPNMRRRVDAAIKAANHLHPKDQAAVQLLRALADAFDQAYADDDGGAVYRKYAGWMAPNIVNAMKSLGLTADSGTKAGFVPPEEKSGALYELRRARHRVMGAGE